MTKASITKRTVDAAKPAAAEYVLWDDEVSGFGLKVTPAGSKVYIYRYRLARPGQAAQTAPAKYTIGKHGNLTPDQARKRAKELAALVDLGVDPRQREQDAITSQDEAMRMASEKARLDGDLAFDRMADLWLDHYENGKGRRPSSVNQAKLVVRNHLKPALGAKPMPLIGRAELQPIIHAIPVKQKGMRRAVFAYASVLFGWAAKRGDIPGNPLATMAKPEAPKPRNRVLSDNELAAVWQASEAIQQPFGTFYQLLILTGQRREEVAGLNWAELDRTAAIWTIPADRAKNGVAHIVPLSAPVIAEMDRLAGDPKGQVPWPTSGYAVTTTGRSPISGFSKAKAALDAAVTEVCVGASLSAWRVHDLRRTMATGFQRLGVRFEVTEATLNHVSGAKSGVAGIYQRHDWREEKRAALEAWGRHISKFTIPASQDNVVSNATAQMG